MLLVVVRDEGNLRGLHVVVVVLCVSFFPLFPLHMKLVFSVYQAWGWEAIVSYQSLVRVVVSAPGDVKTTFLEIIQDLNLVNAQIFDGTKNVYDGCDRCSMCPIACSRCCSCFVFTSVVSVTLACVVQGECRSLGSSAVSTSVWWAVVLGTRLLSYVLCWSCILKCSILQK